MVSLFSALIQKETSKILFNFLITGFHLVLGLLCPPFIQTITKIGNGFHQIKLRRPHSTLIPGKLSKQTRAQKNKNMS